MGLDFNYFLNRQGIQGKRGERGEQGFSPLISVKTQTANEYILTVQNEDGSFDTPNLRGNAIANNGGTYIRYNPLTEEMYTGNADYATNEQAGVVLLASYDQLIAGGSENLIPTSQDVYNFVSQQIISGFVTQQEFDTYTAATAITLNNLSTQKLSFADLSNAIVAGNNITLSVDSENNTITINAAGGDLTNYVTTNTAQTITNSKTFDGNGELHFTMGSNGIYFEDAHAPSSERIRIFGRSHSAGTSYDDLTLKSYMDIQFELSGNGGTTRLSEIKSAMTLANSAVQPEDMTTYLADYVDLTTDQSITGTKTFNNLRVENQLIVPNGYIQSGGTSDLRIRSTVSSITLWGDHIYATTDNINKVDLTHAQVTDNLVTSIDNTSSDTEYPSAKCVYDNLETKADVSQTHALKGYSDNGELLTDAEGLADVINYAHSTFDKSKFTIVGSPVITDDGIASGFIASSGSLPTNGFHTGSINLDVANHEVAMLILLKLSNDFSVIQRVFGAGANNDTIFLNVIPSRRIAFAIKSPLIQTTTSWAVNLSAIDFVDGDELLVKIIINSSKMTLQVKNLSNNQVASDTKIISDVNITSLDFYFGGAFGQTYKGSIDLKQFSITVDGVEVFSGNKTGVDTIKPDDYTTSSTPPTISADGIAYWNNSTSYIDTGVKPDYTKPFKLFARVSVTGLTQAGRFVGFNGTTDYNNIIGLDKIDDNSWRLFISLGGLNTTITERAFNINDVLDIIFEFDGTNTYKLFYKYSTNNEYILLKTITNSNIIPNTNNMVLGYVNYPKLTGFIDLNALKVYVDGNLVYQPCLKIPYTESKTGSKIVDSVYRSRVNDMAKQFGYATYYTLDEDNGNFTLPMGELYGLMGDKTLRDSYYNGITYWELFSNRRLEQGGSCVSGVEYTLPKPFADANYVLTIPYSSKTATSFIPSATGDFIAKGMGLL